VVITKIENLHIGICRQIHWFQKAILFDLRRKVTKLLRKNRFQTVASPGACGRLAVLNWRSSSIHVSSYCYYYYQSAWKYHFRSIWL